MEEKTIKSKKLIIIFADVKGFTNYSLRSPLNKTHRLVEDIIKTADRILDDFTYEIAEFKGDEIMVGFRNPLSALIFLKKFKEVMDDLLKKSKLSMRYGVHMGKVIFIKGEAQGLHATKVIGPDVNVAKKIQDASEGGEVLVSKDFAKQIDKLHIGKKVKFATHKSVFTIPTKKLEFV